ncbi:hypothetical protein SNS2_3213 [Streptomyces netropsis]|uniref:Uncharacterized protein n=1 Tax=Streptomyces syringium TaxID=76729 RepID=A0ABS4Y738_9ACTN|nr:hypothetical protein [Streptomyces syringium]MBP2404598.1 hypothetical protein [Streptomyces syringium]SPE57542.1 hypothetical protein SNS2_3213 [Streptomyces netropsis]
MTQSGQGDEPQFPAAPPAQPVHEGVVLPSRRSHGAPWSADRERDAASDQSWGEPWSAEGQRAPLPPERPQHAPQAPQAAPQTPPVQPPMPVTQITEAFVSVPPPPAHAPGTPPGQGGSEATQYLPPVPPGPMPGGDSASEATQYLPPVGNSPIPGAPVPPAPFAQPASDPVSEATQYLPPVAASGPAPGAGDSVSEATQYLPSMGTGSLPGTSTPTASFARGAADPSAVTPEYLEPGGSPDSPSEATQYLPPVGGISDGIPGGTSGTGIPGPAGADRADQSYGRHAAESAAEATQLLSPQPAAPGDAEATRHLPPVSAQSPAPAARPEEPAAGGPPVFAMRPGQAERPPPAEFDGLFRAAEPTAQLPPVQAPIRKQTPPPGHGPAPSHQGPGGPGRRAPHTPEPYDPYEPPARRKKSPAVLIGAVVAVCAIAGLGAGALLSGGGGEDNSDKQNTSASTAPSEPAKDDDKKTSPPPSPSADPALAQAKALDALLKDSNNSRESVIKAVDSTKSCKNLDSSASDLRAAATQRNGLVTRLDRTPIDKLPDHAELSAQLKKAWQSSASADSHYAKWAKQVDSKRGCIKGHARPTRESAAGDRASGDATAAKKKAAALWNPIAKKYGLSQHTWSQL